MLNQRGNSPRTYRNTLIFLVADRTRIEELKQATRLFKAWDSIEQEREPLNLDAMQWKQARDRRKDAEERILALTPETYSWLLVPEQSNPRSPDYVSEYKLQPQKVPGLLATNASSLLHTEELLITQLAGLRLRQELDRIPLWRGNHVATKELVENFARYIYLPRLKHKDVLIEAMRDGVQLAFWHKDTFAYASRWNEERQRYVNLQAGRAVNMIVDGQSLLVKSEVAEAQMIVEAAELEERQRALKPSGTMPMAAGTGGQAITEGNVHTGIVREGVPEPFGMQNPLPIMDIEEKKLHRFYGSIQINERIMASEAGKIMEEVVKHLTSLSGAKVKVTLEITAELPDGVPEHVVRTVKENSNTLRFQSSEFYEE